MSNTKYKLMALGASAIAVCAIGIGAYDMANGSSGHEQVVCTPVDTSAEATQPPTKTIKKANESEDELTKITKETKQEVTGPLLREIDNHITIAQWRVDIALPSTIKSLSYHFYVKPGYTTLEISGVDCSENGRCQYFPEFGDLSKTDSPLAIISRYDRDSGAQEPKGEKVFSLGSYDFYYLHPQAIYSLDIDETTWEMETISAIQEALTNSNSYSSF